MWVIYCQNNMSASERNNILVPKAFVLIEANFGGQVLKVTKIIYTRLYKVTGT